MPQPLHVVHVVYRFATGGMENVVVQLINNLPRQQFRHSVIALTQADTDFARRIERDDVEIIELNKPPGQPFKLYPAMYRQLRRINPDVLHTCNLAAMEFAPVAFFAGVPRRVHAEHGWDVSDPDGRNPRYRLLRRIYKTFVQQFIAVSIQLHDYLRDVIRVPEQRLHLIPNGVDTQRFRPWQPGDFPPEGWPFQKGEHIVIGSVGRLAKIKNQPLLAQAFVHLVQQNPPGADRLRLAIIGDGELVDAVRQPLADAKLLDRLWLPGNRSDIPEILRALDCFVLPSLAEGTSCTLQEAMATALPIVVTDVGGNADLLEYGAYGHLTPSEDVEAMANALAQHLANALATPDHAPLNNSARVAVDQRYGLASVLKRYSSLFAAIER